MQCKYSKTFYILGVWDQICLFGVFGPNPILGHTLTNTNAKVVVESQLEAYLRKASNVSLTTSQL